MRNTNPLALSLVVLLIAAQRLPAQNKQAPHKPVDEPLSKIVEKHFAQWDRDHNDSLDVAEVDHVVEDHNVHGRQASLVVKLRYYLTDKNNHPTIGHKPLLKLVDEPDFTKAVERNIKKLETIDRELFLAADPNLNTFHQGGLNDCYLLSPIASQIHRNPKTIREMIHPEVTGGFKVHFGDGQKIHVPHLSDSELLLGARLDEHHGSWLAVMEKAYGIIRKRDRAKRGEKPSATAGTEAIQATNWGDSSTTIALLTGHHAESLILKKSPVDKVHGVLAEMTKKKRLLCVGKNKDKAPPGIGTNHVYAILSYDSQARKVTVFNPEWH